MLHSIDVPTDHPGGLHAAVAHAHELLRDGANGTSVRLQLHAGRYPLDGRPLLLSTDGIEIVGSYRSPAIVGSGGASDDDDDAREPETVISGGIRIGQWRSAVGIHDQRLWVAPLPAGGSPRQLWVGGERATPARHPNAGYLRWASALSELPPQPTPF